MKYFGTMLSDTLLDDVCKPANLGPPFSALQISCAAMRKMLEHYFIKRSNEDIDFFYVTFHWNGAFHFVY